MLISYSDSLRQGTFARLIVFVRPRHFKLRIGYEQGQFVLQIGTGLRLLLDDLILLVLVNFDFGSREQISKCLIFCGTAVRLKNDLHMIYQMRWCRKGWGGTVNFLISRWCSRDCSTVSQRALEASAVMTPAGVRPKSVRAREQRTEQAHKPELL